MEDCSIDDAGNVHFTDKQQGVLKVSPDGGTADSLANLNTTGEPRGMALWRALAGAVGLVGRLRVQRHLYVDIRFVHSDTARCRNANTQTLCVASSGNLLTSGFPSTILESGSRG